MSLTFHPLTPDRLSDFETLFGPKGAYSGCWCMYWRLKRDTYEAGRKDGRTWTAMTAIIQQSSVPGILAYDGDQPVWSITCCFVVKGYRRSGVQIVEGYPIEPHSENIPDMYAYMRSLKVFREAGFSEAARRSDSHPVMRYNLA